MNQRVVIVDDAPFMREILKTLLSQLGMTCVGEAGDGDTALQLVAATLPDCVFLDMVLPGKNGLQVGKSLKDRFPEIKIIGCSTLDDAEVLKKAEVIGFSGYIQKPFTKEQIARELNKLVGLEREV